MPNLGRSPSPATSAFASDASRSSAMMRRGSSVAMSPASSADWSSSSRDSVATHRQGSASTSATRSTSHASDKSSFHVKIEKARHLKALANEAYDEGRLTDAFLIFSACVKLDHLNETYWLNRSLVAFDLHLFSRSADDALVALRCIQKANETQSDLDALYRKMLDEDRSRRSVLQRLEQDHQEEIKRLEAKCLLRVGEARLRLGQLEEASHDLAAAAHLRPHCPDILQAQNTLRLVLAASKAEKARWIRQQAPKRTIKAHDGDEDGVFLRAEFEGKVNRLVDTPV